MAKLARRHKLAVESFLEDQSTEAHPFYASYLVHRKHLEPLYSFWAEGFPAGNDHGWGHIERVIENLDQLLRESLDALTPQELYLALVAILYHDWALLRQRKNHPQIGASIILSEQQHGLLSDLERQVVAAIVASHGSQCDIIAQCRGFGEQLRMNAQLVRPRLLAALVRLADELDEDQRRAPERALAIKQLPDSARFYWEFCQHISGIAVDPSSRTVRIFASIKPELLIRSYTVNEVPASFCRAFAEKVFKLETERRAVIRFLPDEIAPRSLTLTVSWGHASAPPPMIVTLDEAVSLQDVLAAFAPTVEDAVNQDLVKALLLASKMKYAEAAAALSAVDSIVADLPATAALRVTYDLACFHCRLASRTRNPGSKNERLSTTISYLERWLKCGQSGGWVRAGQLADNEIYRMTRDADLEWLVYDNRPSLLKLLPKAFHHLLPVRTRRPPGGGGGCLVRGSTVERFEGSTGVEHLREGDRVLAADEAGRVHLYRHNGRVQRITSGRGASAVEVNGSVCFSTRQPLLLADTGWVRAAAVRVGDRLSGPHGIIEVRQVRLVSGPFDLFDLTLEDPLHVYSGNQTWCHNKKK